MSTIASPVTDGSRKFGQWRGKIICFTLDEKNIVSWKLTLAKLKTMRHTWKLNSVVALKMAEYGYYRCDIDAPVSLFH